MTVISDVKRYQSGPALRCRMKWDKEVRNFTNDNSKRSSMLYLQISFAEELWSGIINLRKTRHAITLVVYDS